MNEPEPFAGRVMKCLCVVLCTPASFNDGQSTVDRSGLKYLLWRSGRYSPQCQSAACG